MSQACARARSGAAGVALAMLALTLIAACGGGPSAPTPSPTIAPSPSDTPSPSPIPPPPDTPYLLYYREFGQTQDTIWRVLAKDPAQRVQTAVIHHRDGWGIRPSLSPDSRMLAYLSLPDYAESGDTSQAEAYVLDLKTNETTLLSKGADLTFTPVWSPDSRLLYFRSFTGPVFLAATISIVQIRVPRADELAPTPTATTPPDETPGPTPLPTLGPVQPVLQDTVSHVLSFIPVGFAKDKPVMYFVQVQGGTTAGTVLGSFEPATFEAEEKARHEAEAAAQQLADDQRQKEEAGETPAPDETPAPSPTPASESNRVVSLSDQLAFDYDLSPDASRFAYVVQQFVGDQIVNRAFWADVRGQTTAQVSTNGLPEGHHLHPVWIPDGSKLAMGILRADGSPGAVAVISLDGSVDPVFLPTPASGFDQPVAWDPAGTFLAVTHYSGNSLANLGQARLDVVAPTGQRNTIAQGADNEVLGWYQPYAPPG